MVPQDRQDPQVQTEMMERQDLLEQQAAQVPLVAQDPQQGSARPVQQLVLLVLQQVDLIQPKSLHLVFPQGLRVQLDRLVVTVLLDLKVHKEIQDRQVVQGLLEQLDQLVQQGQTEMMGLLAQQVQLVHQQGSAHQQQVQVR